MLERTLATRAAKLGARPPQTPHHSKHPGIAYRDAGQLDRAIALFERTLAAQTARLGPDHPDTLTTQNDLANAYRDAASLTGRFPCSSGLWRCERPSSAPTIPARSRRAPIWPPPSRRGAILTRAERCFAKSSWCASRSWARSTPTLPGHYQPWAESSLSSGSGPRPSRSSARDWRSGTRAPRRLESIRQPEPLGGSLLGQAKYAEAEPLLLAGYEGMRAREAKTPRVKEDLPGTAGERIVRLYEAWGKPEEAKAWRAKLIPPPTQAKPVPSNPGPSRDCL